MTDRSIERLLDDWLKTEKLPRRRTGFEFFEIFVEFLARGYFGFLMGLEWSIQVKKVEMRNEF